MSPEHLRIKHDLPVIRLCVLLIPAALVVGAAPVFGAEPVLVRQIATSVPTLRDAGGLGRLVALNPTGTVAEFRLTCGWNLAQKRKLHPGVWKVALPSLTFSQETDPSNPAAGSAPTVSRQEWESQAKARGWTGVLEIFEKPFVSNGPTSDVCAGAF